MTVPPNGPTNDRSGDALLDTQIRELLGDAVALTPQPPELDTHMLTRSTRQPRQPNRWIIGGGIGLGAAAAVAGLLIIPNIGTDESVQTPVNSDVSPTTVPVTEPTSPATPETTVPDTITPTTQTPVAAESATPVEPEPEPVTPVTDAPPEAETVEPVPVAEPVAPTLMAGSPSGVVVSFPTTIGADGQPFEERPYLISDTPTSRAVEGGNGFIYLSPPAESAADSPIRRFDLADGSVADVAVPTEPNSDIELLDVATVQGETTLLYSVRIADCTNPNDATCRTSLRTYQPATEVAVILNEEVAWEFSYGAFHLADNGLIFGTSRGIVSDVPTFSNISTGPTPTTAAVGLAESYDDCSDCPTGFTIDRTGEHVAWFGGGGGGPRIVIRQLATGDTVDVALTMSDGSEFGARGGELQISAIDIVDGAVLFGQAIVNADPDGTANVATLIDLASGTAEPLAQTPGFEGVLQPGSYATIR